MSNNNYINAYEVNNILCDKLKFLNPISYDEPNDPRLLNIDIIIDCYTVICLYGTVYQCDGISIYNSKNKSIREPTSEEIKRKWYYDRSTVYVDCDIFDDSNEICDIKLTTKDKLDNAINIIENSLINIGYDLGKKK